MQTISDLLSQFNIEISLPDEVLSLSIEGKYISVDTQEVLLDIFKEGILDKQYFECYLFKGDECEIIICPDNPLQMVSIYKELPNLTTGVIYDGSGMISGRI